MKTFNFKLCLFRCKIKFIYLEIDSDQNLSFCEMYINKYNKNLNKITLLIVNFKNLFLLQMNDSLIELKKRTFFVPSMN